MEYTKKWLKPILVLVGVLVIVTVLTFPMLNMEVKDIPVGIISLDEGAVTPAGEGNAGKEITSQITAASNGVVDWKQPQTEKELNESLKNSDYYATVIIPKDFTVSNLSGAVNSIQATINEGKNPMVSMALNTMLASLAQGSGLKLDINIINPISQYGILGMLLPMLLMLMTFIPSLVTGFFATTALPLKGTAATKLKTYLLQMIYLVILALATGFFVSGISRAVTGLELDIVKIGLYLSSISFAFMALVNGSANLLGKKGLVIPIIIIILGMGTVTIPFEYLPSGFQLFVASWEPMRYMSEGIREILYQRVGLWNRGTPAIITVAVVGLILSMFKLPLKEHKV